ncbi:DUF2730 family protein [Rhodobacter capsulatus]|uniref:DUF2730 family protein n=1 Tax=Rhodobacter capsulatus TaxID=1061 RepID=UPI0003D38BB7|nr:DUF2730 family protein [Rhodobacter capsulatus]ETD85736.1 hypothetical protein U703_02125 [Rhodobacter capsulatus YW1]
MSGEVLNISPIVVWAVALSQLLTFGLTIWNLMASGSRANAKRLAEQAAVLDAHNLRITGLETGRSQLPSNKDLHELELAMEQLKGDIRAMTAAMTGQSAIMERLEQIVARHEQHLLDGGKR